MLLFKGGIVMINREQRKKDYEYEHRPEWQKTLEKILKYAGIAFLALCVLFAIANPKTWIFAIAYLVLSPMWNN